MEEKLPTYKGLLLDPKPKLESLAFWLVGSFFAPPASSGSQRSTKTRTQLTSHVEVAEVPLVFRAHPFGMSILTPNPTPYLKDHGT